jgi:glycerol uptake facilitator protein
VGIGLSLGGPTGYAINPARDLGPRLAHALLPIPNKGTSEWRYSWIPVVGPIAGAAIGAGIYNVAF